MLRCLLLLAFVPLAAHAQIQRFSFTQPKMGSYFSIIFYDNDSLHAKRLAKECFAIVDSLNEIYSDYIPTSELNRLSATSGKKEWMHISPALLDVLLAAKRAWQLTDGAFDITVGPAVKLWRKARRDSLFPAPHEINAALKSIGFQFLLLDSTNSKAQLTKPAMQLDLGGIGQGYIAQKVLEFLNYNNIAMALVDASGDIVLGAAPPEKKGWKIAVNSPGSADDLLSHQIISHNTAVITSGDVYQYMAHDGRRYSHIINPMTGYGITKQRNATVIADNGITADWFATACTILPIKKIKKLARKIGASYLIGIVKKGRITFYKSKCFEQFNNIQKDSSD